MPTRIHATVRGRVQGVGYRFFARRVALEARLTGWVRNCSDGSVELEAQGERPHLEALAARLEQGPALAQVTAVALSERPLQHGEQGFEVRD